MPNYIKLIQTSFFLIAFTYVHMDHWKANISSEWLECTVLKVYTLIHHWHIHFYKILECKVTCPLIFEVRTVVLIKMQLFRYGRPCHLSSCNLPIWDCQTLKVGVVPPLIHWLRIYHLNGHKHPVWIGVTSQRTGVFNFPAVQNQYSDVSFCKNN